jgi:hypothetical protein
MLTVLLQMMLNDHATGIQTSRQADEGYMANIGYKQVADYCSQIREGETGGLTARRKK